MNNIRSRLKPVSPEVFYSDGGFFAVDADIVALLKKHAIAAERRRSRLCFHAGPEAAQQEMLIVMHRSSYVRPHRHHAKLETLTVVEGRCDAVLFDDGGGVVDVVSMTPAAEGGCFFYRMPEGLYHTLVFRSDWLVFLETTIGPFDRTMTEMAPWAPPEADSVAGAAFLAELLQPAR